MQWKLKKRQVNANVLVVTILDAESMEALLYTIIKLLVEFFSNANYIA